MGADRGGWDLTQVLRIPGTPNLKYADKPLVRLKYFKDTVLRKVPQRPLDRWRASIPRKLLRLVEGPAEQGKRSDMLWYLEHELCDLGIPIKDVFSILRESEWNKYRGALTKTSASSPRWRRSGRTVVRRRHRPVWNPGTW
jgi:hypothetical protein